VDRLAAVTRPRARVLDLGCGTGAYTHWFAGRTTAWIIALDWSETALRHVASPRRGTVARVCADARYLPLKQECIEAVFSIDTLGHIARRETVLDELVRVTAPGARLFLHSECADPVDRWPDRMLVRRLGTDAVGEQDGHVDLPRGDDMHRAFGRRFALEWFASPAGLAGWLLGYPEKYRPAFRAAKAPFLTALTSLFAALKRMPVAGGLMRLTNALTNHLELFLGLTGGGSCFALLVRKAGTKPPVKR
jgi:SAM-dependent methyltransferase